MNLRSLICYGTGFVFLLLAGFALYAHGSYMDCVREYSYSPIHLATPPPLIQQKCWEQRILLRP